MIIGVVNPLAPPSPYDFDVFDTSLVDVWITNDSQSRGLDGLEGRKDLEAKILAALTGWTPTRVLQ
jgi:hypothetical protein